MIVEINGVEVQVVKKLIKNLHLYVKPPDGHVEVSAPLMASDECIKMFIRGKIGWIKQQKLKFSEQLRQTKREYVSGEALYVWGVQYYLLVNYSNKNKSLILDGNKAILTVRKESTDMQRANFVNEWYRSLLKVEIERVISKWGKITNIHPDAWQIKNMTTRWATCNVQAKKIWFNLQLAKKTSDCLEYIVLYELLHLKEKCNNDKLVYTMNQYMPNWKELRKKLNEQILDYME